MNINKSKIKAMILAMVAVNSSTALATTIPSSEAINNNTAKGTSTRADIVQDFKDITKKVVNADACGGAIYNSSAEISNIVGNFINNTVHSTNEAGGKPKAYGGAIYNQLGVIGNIEGDFSNNTASVVGGSNGESYTYGGAIYNFNSHIGNIVGNFNENTASGGRGNYGGAIYNTQSSIGNITGSFIGNGIDSTNAKNQDGYPNTGGAIYNGYNGGYGGEDISTIGVITGNFHGNYIKGDNNSSYGGAIGNGLFGNTGNAGQHGIAAIVGNFVDNYVQNTVRGNAHGGAIYNTSAFIGYLQGDFAGNYVSTQSGSAHGGAIYNAISNIDSITGNFIGNFAMSDSGSSYGGAIYNYYNASITNITGDFIGNYAQGTSVIGGAIRNNESSIDNISGNFFGNYAKATGLAIGGAIANSGATASIIFTDSSFIDNYAESTGGKNSAYAGAIANLGGTIGIHAITKDTVISGNYTSTFVAMTEDDEAKTLVTQDAIYNTGIINFNTADGLKVIINDSMVGSKGTMNINKAIDDTNAPVEGTVVFNNFVSGQTINLYDGTLIMGSVVDEEGNVLSYGNFDKTVTLNHEGGTIHHQDGQANTMNVGKLNLNKDTDAYLDADLASNTMDNYKVNDEEDNGADVTVAAGVKLTVKGINLLSDSIASSTVINFTDDEYLKDAVNFKDAGDMQNLKGTAPIYTYDISYDSTSGDFTFDRTASFNPAILVTPAAAQIGAYMTQVNSFEQAFSNYDMITSLHQKQRNWLYNQRAATSKGSFWLRPYSSFGAVCYSNIPSVDERNYGSYAGFDSAITEIGKRWSMIYSAYAGYNDSEQKFDGATIKQNGFIFGLSALLYKENLWTSFTMNLGALSADANTMYGDENFNMLTSGVASKAGYNIELQDGDYILQPNLQLSYSYVNTKDHHNAAGVYIQSGNFNSFQVAPGLRFISNQSQVWQPYVSVRMVWDLNDESNFTADGEALPNLSIDPYIEYGTGMQWHYSESMRFNGSVMLRSGGRRGASFKLGMSWFL